MKAAWAILLLIPLAGCVDDAPDKEPVTPVSGTHVPDMQPARAQEFFSGVSYDANLTDLDKLSKPIYDILPPQEIFTTMSDGIAISNMVFRPDTSEPVPVFINFSPYWGETAAAKGDNFGKYLVDQFVPRGYAVSLTSLRGTSHSDGCFEVGSEREVHDLYEVIDYFASQDWSNGNIAAGGKSYDSTPQNGLIANDPHPALKGLFHVSGITDMYSYTFRHGVLERADGGLFTTTYSSGYGGDQTCPEYAEGVVFPASTTATGAKTPYWIERDWTRTIGDTDWNGSIFFYHGYQDWNVQPSHILPWIDNLPDHITEQTKIWLHQDRSNNGHQYPQRLDWNLTMLRWMDQTLKGIDAGFWMEPRVEVEDVDGTWHALPDWPAPMVEVGTLMAGATINPVGRPIVSIPVEDANQTDAAGNTHISGALRIHTTVASTNPDGVASAVIYRNGEWVGEAVLRLIYRDTLDMPSPIVAGQGMSIVLETYPLDVVVGPTDTLTISFGVATQKTIVVPTALEGVVYNAPITVELPAAIPTPVAIQPTPIDCFAC